MQKKLKRKLLTFSHISDVQDTLAQLISKGWYVVNVHHNDSYHGIILEKFNPKKGYVYIPARKKIKIL